MTMFKTKPPLKTRIQRWFMRFNMCQCSAPRYAVLKGVLCCELCSKATNWLDKPQEDVS